GATEPTGQPSPTRPQGPTGNTSATGTQGLKGPAGPVGAPGATGPQGTAGAHGPAGPAGATGSIGPMGLPGPAGSANSQVWNTFLAGSLSSVFTAGRLIPDGDLSMTRIQVVLGTAPLGCITNAVIQISD